MTIPAPIMKYKVSSSSWRKMCSYNSQVTSRHVIKLQLRESGRNTTCSSFYIKSTWGLSWPETYEPKNGVWPRGSISTAEFLQKVMAILKSCLHVLLSWQCRIKLYLDFILQFYSLRRVSYLLFFVPLHLLELLHICWPPWPLLKNAVDR